MVLNATHGAVALSALEAVGAQNLAGKVLIELALPLDFSPGMPPTLTIANSDSLGEQIQHAIPGARVVKTLNTVFANVMVDPARVPGHHTVFLAGEDAEAKQVVSGLLREFGWPEEDIFDLGGIRAACGVEMYSRLCFELAGILGFDFNIGVVR